MVPDRVDNNQHSHYQNEWDCQWKPCTQPFKHNCVHLYLQSCVIPCLLSFENHPQNVHPQNVPLPNPKMHYCAIFQPANPETWQECFTLLCTCWMRRMQCPQSCPPNTSLCRRHWGGAERPRIGGRVNKRRGGRRSRSAVGDRPPRFLANALTGRF